MTDKIAETGFVKVGINTVNSIYVFEYLEKTPLFLAEIKVNEKGIYFIVVSGLFN